MSVLRKTRRRLENLVAWVLALTIILLVVAGVFFVVTQL